MVRNGLPYQKFEKYLFKTIEESENILDIGTLQRFAKELKPYENILAKKNYIAAGYKPSKEFGQYNCDCHQDIENMRYNDNEYDSIICLEVLEHVRNPFKAVSEIKRVLNGGGKLLLTVPFLTQYHGKGSKNQSHDSYPDFWRFTHEGLELLFNDFQYIEVIPIDGPIEFRLRQMYMGKYLDKYNVFRNFIDKIDKPKKGKSTTRHLVYGVK